MSNDALQPRHDTNNDDAPALLQLGLFGELLPAPSEHVSKRPRDMTSAERTEHEHDLRRARAKKRREAGNPMLAKVGPYVSPDGSETRCATCEHLVAYKQSATWYKCRKRGKPTHGEATDHRVRWPACALYEQRKGPKET